MSRTTMFVALQCCECVTMQVKQQKKSGNKWTCVVCNQKQSVTKVFAQGPMAKDLRKFVQSFNMSRKLAYENRQPFPESDYSIMALNDDDEGKEKMQNQSKRRTDWTEYLELENHCENEREDDLEPKIVTEEIMKEMFKRPKLRNYYAAGRGEDHAYKPVFSKRNVKPQDDCAVRYEMVTKEGVRGSKRTSYKVETDKLSCRIKMARAESKWDEYVTQDAGDLQLGSRRNNADRDSEVGNGLLQTDTDDLTVEDEVHPDFM